MHQEQSLLTRLRELETRQTGPSVEIGKSILSELGGAIVGEVFGSERVARHGRRITKALVEQRQKELPQSEEQTIETEHQQYLNSILTYLFGISVKKPNLKEPNSRTLVDKINKAQNYVRLETRIRNTIIALQNIINKDLVLNTEIPKLSKEKTISHITDTESYTALKELENKLRQCIQTKTARRNPKLVE